MLGPPVFSMVWHLPPSYCHTRLVVSGLPFWMMLRMLGGPRGLSVRVCHLARYRCLSAMRGPPMTPFMGRTALSLLLLLMLRVSTW